MPRVLVELIVVAVALRIELYKVVFTSYGEPAT